jgi:KipI family sensor histidine kinase inhibitor
MAIIEPFGDAAVLISLGDEVTVETAARAQALARRIRAAGRPHGWVGVVPAAASILVQVPPEPGEVERAIERLDPLVRAADEATWPPDAAQLEIPLRYGGEDGPDLASVAAATGLTAEQVIEAHAGVTYRVLFLGFAPGFAYLGPLPAELVIARRADPRVRVPAGSVAIAGPYSAVYPIESPGGWHLIGRTSRQPWDPARSPASLFEPGALVRFVPDHS